MVKIISHTPKAPEPGAKSKRQEVRSNTLRDNQSHHFVLTCQSGLESLVKRECERIGLEDIHVQDRLVKCDGTEKNMYELLIWSRFANRVYLDLTPPSLRGDGGSLRITDFDTLHDTLSSIDWSAYLTGKERIVIEASSTKSTLASVPTIQSVGQNAIFSTLHTPNYTNDTEVHILILIIDDIAHILLDVTGDPLHKRGYRREAGEAPLKENLAAALLVFSGWRYREPLRDPFCGSGTIAIEAAMMARNIAPGLFRGFRIEELPCHSEVLLEGVRGEAEKKIYPSGGYTILASDIEPEMIRIAEENARRAGVAGDITFSVSDFLDGSGHCEVRSNPGTGDSGSPHSTNAPFAMTGTIVTNPPYGNRLQSDTLADIYKKLIHSIEEHGGGFISSYHVDIRHGLANRKLLNGGEECRFWYKKATY